MPAPTRAQIDANVALPKFRVSIWNSGTSSWTVLDNDDIVSVDSTIESGNTANGLAFGEAVSVSASVVLANTASIPANWKLAKIRIEYTYDTADWVNAFNGFITGRTRGTDTFTLSCGGIDKKLEQIKIDSQVYYRRPIASKTTALSVEDPTNVAYSETTTGLLNYIFWQAGGRPYEQAASYTTADFYYSCNQSLIDPEWSWFAGENILDELYTLARAGGGQIYQGTDNVIRYVQPLQFSGSSTYTITDDYYGDLSVSEETNEAVGKLRTVYTPRYVQGAQVIYDDTTARLILPGGNVVVDGETQLPIYRYVQISGNTTTIKATTSAADPVQLTNYSIYTYAQRFTLTIYNTLTYPVAVNSIELQGNPVAAREKGFVSYGSGTPERTLEDNPYIQDKFHAERLTRMAYDFYAPLQPVLTLGNCGYDPDRFVGETVTLSSTLYPSFNGAYRIVGTTRTLPGITMDLRLVSVSGLPLRSEMFVIGTTYASGDTRKVAY